MKKMPDPNILLDHNSILRKVIKLKYTIEPAIDVPSKLTSLIIIDIPQCQRTLGHHQNGQHDQMLFLVDWYMEGCAPMYQPLQAMYIIPSKQDVHPAITFRNTTGTICRVCYGLQWALPTTSKDHKHALTFICLLSSYLITVTLRTKTADDISMAYMKETLPKTSCPKFIQQDNGTEFKYEQLMSMFNSLGIKHIYSNPYYPKGNSRIENVHNFLKHTIA